MRTIEAAPSRLVTDGRIQFGTFGGPITDVNLLDAKVPSLPLPRRLKTLRLKEWETIQIVTDTHFVVVALFDAKLLSLAQVKVYDRERRQKHMFERKVPPWAFQPVTSLLDSALSYEAQGVRVRFENRMRDGWVRMVFDVPGDACRLEGDVRIDASGEEHQVVSIPFAENRGMYSHKGMMPVSGTMRLGGQEIAIARGDGVAFVDDHKGYYPYVMRWDWVTGAGRAADGTFLGFNLTRNDSVDPARYNENCLWHGGKPHLLPPVRFDRRKTGSEEVWTVRDEEGLVDVRFIVEVEGRVDLQALIVESRYRGPFGRFEGTIVDSAGTKHDVGRAFGMGEDFYLRI